MNISVPTNNAARINNNIILNAANYTDYTVTKTGSGASGTWGINVSGSSASCTGNAATATRAALLNELDLRSTNENPSWYMGNYDRSLKAEFKSTSSIGAIGDGTGYHLVLTATRWPDSSGGRPVQFACDNNGIQFRTSASDTT